MPLISASFHGATLLFGPGLSIGIGAKRKRPSYEMVITGSVHFKPSVNSSVVGVGPGRAFIVTAPMLTHKPSTLGNRLFA